MFSLLEALRETCFRKPEVNLRAGLEERRDDSSGGAKGFFGSRPPAMPPDKIQPTVGMNLEVGCEWMSSDVLDLAARAAPVAAHYAGAHGWVTSSTPRTRIYCGRRATPSTRPATTRI